MTSCMLIVEQLLRDGEMPAIVKEQWADQGVEPQFQLRLRASGIIRIQHRLDGDQEVSKFIISCVLIIVYLNLDIPESNCDTPYDIM